MKNSKFWPLSRSVPVRQRLTPVTGTFWFPRALCESDVLMAAWQPDVECCTSQCGDAQKPWLEEAPGLTSWSAYHAREPDQERVLLSLVQQQVRGVMHADTPFPWCSTLQHLPGQPRTAERLSRGCWRDSEGVSLSPCYSRWVLVRGKTVCNFRAGNEGCLQT